eukprot:772426-Amphidinium_carterae.1
MRSLSRCAVVANGELPSIGSAPSLAQLLWKSASAGTRILDVRFRQCLRTKAFLITFYLKTDWVPGNHHSQAPTLDWGDLTQPLLSSVPPKSGELCVHQRCCLVFLVHRRSSTQGASPLTGTSSLLRKSTSSGIKGLPNSVSLREHLRCA